MQHRVARNRGCPQLPGPWHDWFGNKSEVEAPGILERMWDKYKKRKREHLFIS